MVILYRLKGDPRPRAHREENGPLEMDPSWWACSFMVDGRWRVYRLPAAVGQDLLQDDRDDNRDHHLYARHQDDDGFAPGASAESVPVPRPQPTIR
jgi:hypothetical protein